MCTERAEGENDAAVVVASTAKLREGERDRETPAPPQNPRAPKGGAQHVERRKAPPSRPRVFEDLELRANPAMFSEREGYNIRFRHVAGDFGPYVFPKTSTVMTLKEKIMEEWPGMVSSGSLVGANIVAPKTASELRIIFGGRMLDNQKLVKELQHSMGNPQGQKMVTMHVVVRQPSEDKGVSSGGRKKATYRCCVVQ